MKICMFGMGSIGIRHLNNLVTILNNKGIEYIIDALRSSDRCLPENVTKVLNKQIKNVNELENDYDVAFITNPTILHYDTLKLAVTKAKHIFIEKPIFDDTSYNISELNLKDNCTYYVACPLRYTKVIQYLKEFVKGRNIYSARVICSTYLPDWRPNVDYRNTYSANSELGGGVAIDLIHEWDYINYLFGTPDEISLLEGHYSDLEITSNDIALYSARYKDKLISVHLDYFGRANKREIELYLSDDMIVGNLITNEIIFSKENKIIKFNEERNDYQKREIEHFFDIITGKSINDNSIHNALSTLKIAKGEL